MQQLFCIRIQYHNWKAANMDSQAYPPGDSKWPIFWSLRIRRSCLKTFELWTTGPTSKVTVWSPGNFSKHQKKHDCNFKIWVFPKIKVPQNGWFIMENRKTLLKWMIWGYHYFWNIHIPRSSFWRNANSSSELAVLKACWNRPLKYWWVK